MCEAAAIGIDAASIREGFARVDRLMAQLHAAVAAFDSAQLWDLEGAASMTAWLKSAGVAASEAKRITSTARRLASLPVTSAAWASGVLSGGQVRAIVANVRDATEQFAAEEAELVPLLAKLTVTQVATAMQAWRSDLDEDLDEEPERHLHVSKTMDGRHVIDGSLDAEGGTVVATALRVAMADDRDKTVSERQADALVEVCRFFLDNQTTRRGGRHRPHVNLVIDVETFRGGVLDGPRLGRAALKRALCDAGVHRVVTAGEFELLDIGRTTRTIPAPLWSALVLRDQHCRFPGCDRPSNWCDGHHVEHWADGGTTSLDNLVLLCSRHHHVCHRPGWSAKLLPDGSFEVNQPP